jgi:hypothetical protein
MSKDIKNLGELISEKVTLQPTKHLLLYVLPTQYVTITEQVLDTSEETKTDEEAKTKLETKVVPSLFQKGIIVKLDSISEYAKENPDAKVYIPKWKIGDVVVFNAKSAAKYELYDGTVLVYPMDIVGTVDAASELEALAEISKQFDVKGE